MEDKREGVSRREGEDEDERTLLSYGRSGIEAGMEMAVEIEVV